MKNSPLTTMLLGAAAIVALGAVGFCYMYLQNTGEVRALQAQAQQVQARQQIVQALVTDVAGYSQKNPAVEPILESVGVTNRAARTESKPSSK